MKHKKPESYLGKCYKLNSFPSIIFMVITEPEQSEDGSVYLGIKAIKYSDGKEKIIPFDWMCINKFSMVVDGLVEYGRFLGLDKTEINPGEYKRIFGKIKKNVEKSNY